MRLADPSHLEVQGVRREEPAECHRSPNVTDHRLSSSTECYRMSSNSTECHRIPSNVIEFHRIPPNVIEFHRMASNSRMSPNVTVIIITERHNDHHRMSPNVTA